MLRARKGQGLVFSQAAEWRLIWLSYEGRAFASMHSAQGLGSFRQHCIYITTPTFSVTAFPSAHFSLLFVPQLKSLAISLPVTSPTPPCLVDMLAIIFPLVSRVFILILWDLAPVLHYLLTALWLLRPRIRGTVGEHGF